MGLMKVELTRRIMWVRKEGKKNSGTTETNGRRMNMEDKRVRKEGKKNRGMSGINERYRGL